jgi:hypothetical protein
LGPNQVADWKQQQKRSLIWRIKEKTLILNQISYRKISYVDSKQKWFFSDKLKKNEVVDLKIKKAVRITLKTKISKTTDCSIILHPYLEIERQLQSKTSIKVRQDPTTIKAKTRNALLILEGQG